MHPIDLLTRFPCCLPHTLSRSRTGWPPFELLCLWPFLIFYHDVVSTSMLRPGVFLSFLGVKAPCGLTAERLINTCQGCGLRTRRQLAYAQNA